MRNWQWTDGFILNGNILPLITWEKPWNVFAKRLYQRMCSVEKIGEETAEFDNIVSCVFASRMILEHLPCFLS